MLTNIPVPKPDKDNPYSPPGPRPTSLGLENNGGPIAFEYFQGMNLGTTRAGIDNKEMWWCDGWMPVAPRQLRTLPGVGPLLWTTPAATQVVFFAFANINALPLMIAVVSDGSIYQVRTDTGVETQIAPAGTIQNPSRETVDISQWGADFVIIEAVQTNGYFLWDGLLFHGAGSLSPPITFDYNGSGYTGNPAVTVFGGSGSGASVTAYVAPGSGIVTDGSIVAIGSGYLANDVVGLAFSGGGPTAKTAILTPVISSGSITSVVLTDPGAGYTPFHGSVGAVGSVYGGGGTGASISVTVASGTISGVSIVDGGGGYLTQPTIIVTDVNNPVARATVGLMPYAIQGNAVETYAGHVWVANGPTIFYSAPGSPQDFSTNNGGGNFTSTDSFLRIGFTHLIQTNGFLYMFGDSSINYISGVQTAGTPPTTSFSNQNVDPEIGTPYSGSVLASSRAVLFANSFGVHSLSGSSVTKISGDLDGIWNSLANFGGFDLSSAKALIYGKRVWMILSKITDPLSGSIVNKLFMYHNKQWWASGQDIDLTYIASQEINSVLTAWGTDGTSIYPLFQEGSADFTKTVQTRLYDQPGGYPWTKASTRFWSMFYFEGDDAVAVEVDAENQTFGNINTYTFTSPTPTIEVQNASLTVIPVVNQSSVTITVESVTSGYFITEPTAIGQQGELIGLTIRTDEPDLTLVSASMDANVVQYRG